VPQKPVIAWNTTKTAEGFEFHVYSFGYQIPQETLKRGTARSRAIATRLGRQWARYFKRAA
jgi:hypothetical protein